MQNSINPHLCMLVPYPDGLDKKGTDEDFPLVRF